MKYDGRRFDPKVQIKIAIIGKWRIVIFKINTICNLPRNLANPFEFLHFEAYPDDFLKFFLVFVSLNFELGRTSEISSRER